MRRGRRHRCAPEEQPGAARRVAVLVIALVLIALPFAITQAGTAWVRITNLALLFTLLALGLNIVVGFAGLLDLGYVAFYAVGAYVYALLASPHFGLHLPFWVILPIGALRGRAVRRAAGRADAEAARRLSRHRHAGLRRDRAHLPEQPVAAGEHHQRPAGHRMIDPFRIGDFSFSKNERSWELDVSGPMKYYYCCSRCWCCDRDQHPPAGFAHRPRLGGGPRGRDRRARAMGINTRNVKLLAFAMGASFGGVAGGMFAAIQGFISPESFVLVESVMVLAMVVLGGMGNIWGVIIGALLLSFVPELLRYTVEPIQKAAVRQDADRARGDSHAALRPGAGADDALPSGRPAAVGGQQARTRGRRSK
jgi:branched-chain amino acid transport system permease protein